MNTIRKLHECATRFEYGLDGVRLLPWEGLHVPFAGGYCIVRPGSSSTAHVNSPDDEEELFICISGKAQVVLGEEVTEVQKGDIVFIPKGIAHYVRNAGPEPFHFYALWWNSETAGAYLGQDAPRGS